jgi:hypothetical protein
MCRVLPSFLVYTLVAWRFTAVPFIGDEWGEVLNMGYVKHAWAGCATLLTLDVLFTYMLYERIFHFAMDDHIRGSGHVACIEEIRDTYRCWLENVNESPRHRWEDNIRMYIKTIWWVCGLILFGSRWKE